MNGNVREWCSDFYGDDYYAISPLNNPKGPGSGSNHISRGGGWEDDYNHCRISFRDHINSDWRLMRIGFRLVNEI